MCEKNLSIFTKTEAPDDRERHVSILDVWRSSAQPQGLIPLSSEDLQARCFHGFSGPLEKQSGEGLKIHLCLSQAPKLLLKGISDSSACRPRNPASLEMLKENNHGGLELGFGAEGSAGWEGSPPHPSCSGVAAAAQTPSCTASCSNR